MANGQDLLKDASIALQRKEFETAKTILDELNLQPERRSLQSLLMHGTSLEALGFFDEAASAFMAAEALTPEADEKVKILHQASSALIKKNNNNNILLVDDMKRAAAWMERSKLLDSTQTNALADVRLCQICDAIQKYDAIKIHAERLLKFPAYFVAANMWLARACYHLGDRTQGLAHLSALADRFDDLDRLTQRKLLGLLIDFQAFTEAEALINRLLPERKHVIWLQQLRAVILYHKKEYGAALNILTDSFMFTRAINAKSAARSTYSLRAKVLQAMGKYQEAHKDFTVMNRLARTKYKPAETDDPVDRYSSLPLENLPLDRNDQSLPYTPVFMIGFPRSGTTLLETILSTQAGIQTLSEVGGIAIARQETEQLGRTFPDDIAALTEQEIDLLRDKYLKHNAQFLDADRKITVLIDKLPMNLIHVPFIRILFPEAKFIFSLRHPVDVCLSCFQQDFSLNEAMIYFTDLEQSFIRYRDVMSLFETYRAKLDLDLHTVRYEDLVANIDNVANGVFSFLNVKADGSYRDFYKHNQEKIISTPSREQVSQPIYRSSQYRWKNYADQLEPYIPIVQQFISRYGYTQ